MNKLNKRERDCIYKIKHLVAEEYNYYTTDCFFDWVN